MKRTIVFVMLLLSTSMAMAQFGDIDDIINKANQEGDSGKDIPSSPTDPTKPDNGKVDNFQLIEKCIADGFFLVRQEYQLEQKTNPGSRFNWGEEQFFDYRVGFMVRLKNGFIIPDRILSPWTEDAFEENRFIQYKETHNPVFSKTLTMKLGQKGWKTEGKVFRPKEEDNLYNGLKYVKDDGWEGDGFLRTTGYGKKDVYVVWLIYDREQQDNQPISFRIERMELEIEQGKYGFRAFVPEKPYHKNVEGGIVLEPVTNGMGRIDLALVGVIDNYNDEQPDDDLKRWYFNISLLGQNMSESVDSNNDNSLTPTEGANSGDNNNKESSKQ